LSPADPLPVDNGDVAVDAAAARWVFLGMMGLIFGGVLTYFMLRTPPPPPTPEVAADPLLLEGRSVYLARCASCHGQEGRGDGPIAGSLSGPAVGNISDGNWKHGGKPEEVLRVISRGVEGTRMAGWDVALESSQLRAVTAYVFSLARQPVPEVFRQSAPSGPVR
jgi:cytochrome c oxidase cbb3-type subunit 3